MKVVTHKDIIEANISSLECYSWVSESIARKREAMLPPKISLKPREGVFYNTMPSIISNMGGGKVN